MLGLELRDATAVAIAVDDDGRVLARDERPFDGNPGAAAVAALDAVARQPAIVGIAAVQPDQPGLADVVAAVVGRYGGDPGPSTALLRASSGRPGGVVDSGVAAAVAEAWTGAAAGERDVVYFAGSEHTLAGIVSNGQPWLGAHGRAGAAAWLALNPVEREDYRKHGSLEAEAAAHGIVRRLVWRVKAGDRSRVEEAVKGDFSAITIGVVLDAAREGDGVSISVMRDTAKYLGMGAANLIAAIDPDVLVLGGIMADSPDLLFEQVRTELARRLAPATYASLRIVPAALGRDAAAIGAARLAAAALQ